MNTQDKKTALSAIIQHIDTIDQAAMRSQAMVLALIGFGEDESKFLDLPTQLQDAYLGTVSDMVEQIQDASKAIYRALGGEI